MNGTLSGFADAESDEPDLERSYRLLEYVNRRYVIGEFLRLVIGITAALAANSSYANLIGLKKYAATTAPLPGLRG